MTTILVVDDEVDVEPLMQNWFRRKIQQETYLFRFAYSGREALTLLQSEQDIDLVLLDINMPDMDGLTLLNELSTLDRFLGVVMVSAYSDMNNIRIAMNRGAFDFVVKPIDFADLEVTIEKTAQYVRQLRESQQLKVISELKTRFYDNITHEFRTPLTLILSPVEKLLQKHREPEELLMGLNMVERNAQQLLRLVNQLLDLAKLESGHLSLSPRTGDLSDFIGQIVQLFKPIADERGLTLTYQSDLTSFYSFDTEKVEQLVYNLVANALKFTPAGSVTIALKKGDSVRIVVSDTGIGIASEKLPYIFNRFYQVISPQPLAGQYLPDTSDKVPAFLNSGTGIGLALVKELTELMNGTVAVESTVSKSPGQPSGTVFTVELPLPTVESPTVQVVEKPVMQPLDWSAQSTSPQPAPDTTSEPADTILLGVNGEKPLVLIVEDNSQLRMLLERQLSGLYRVLTAVDGEMGWQIAQNELPDLVLTDVSMPKMDGYELTRRLKTSLITDHIAVVMLTAKTAQPSRIQGLQEGADDYINKPFHVDELRLRLKNLFIRQQKLRAYYQNIFSQPDVSFQPATATDKFLQTLYSLIEAHLDDSRFGVEELAHEVGMSRRTLYRKLLVVTNLTINDFMRQYRLRRAAQFLREGRNVSETAYLVGYESPAHFTTVFKEFYNRTPSEYADL
ncbi:response regulator [Spirosoma linguale]|uniref:histidine kinase n=1 Tax=Spirosoma linguale (strain ATCC 33905 / DSM 74 / LMG 10896 / Claus 1) TaxID=504472 RepID=D2QT77_SPILD|nr:response regulator receiver sensor hybrid histidine kinase [Spirosoma linguale DSM 74]